MKTTGRISLGILFILLLSACGSSKVTEQDVAEVKQMIDSKDYTILANMAHPTGGGKTISLSSMYSLKVKNDSVYSHLPYYGRAYSVPYGGGDGLRFDAPINDYTINYNRKGTAEIRFNARTNEDRYEFFIEVFRGGSSRINVVMQNRQSISFTGDVDRWGRNK